jgi:hypothetical protein
MGGVYSGRKTKKSPSARMPLVLSDKRPRAHQQSGRESRLRLQRRSLVKIEDL